MRLIHLTDPHLSSLRAERFISLRGKRWSGYLSWRKNRSRKYLPSVLNHMVDAIGKEGADEILLTGDLIQIGLDQEIEQASDWLEALGSPKQVMLVPGNHDIYARGSADAVHAAWRDYLFSGQQTGSDGGSDEFPVLRKRGKLSFIGLSSACVTPVFMATGKLGNTQLDKLTGLLKQAADEDQLVCLLIHHPPLPGMTSWRKALTDAKALQKVLSDHPPALILHGHLHHNRELQWSASHIYCTCAASSASDASYRVFDIDENDESWNFQMTLKSISMNSGEEPEVVVVDQQCWEVPKTLKPKKSD